jgi:alcohol dehydrogenase
MSRLRQFTEAVTGMVGLVRGGLLDLEHFAVTEFIIENANESPEK